MGCPLNAPVRRMLVPKHVIFTTKEILDVADLARNKLIKSIVSNPCRPSKVESLGLYNLAERFPVHYRVDEGKFFCVRHGSKPAVHITEIVHFENNLPKYFTDVGFL